MIGHIEGEVFAVRLPTGQAGIGFAILSAGGVGYKLAATRETLAKLSAQGRSAPGGKPGEKAALWTYLAVREDSLDLYGFSAEEELHFFQLLLTVSGIGPKSALTILDIASVETLRSAIVAGKAEYLTKVSGVGKKTAEKIVLELRDKVGKGSESSSRTLSGDEEALEAMRSLGYSPSEAREALRKVPEKFESGSARLREALKIVGSK